MSFPLDLVVNLWSTRSSTPYWISFKELWQWVHSHILAWKNIYNSKHLKTFHLLTGLVFKGQVTGKAGGWWETSSSSLCFGHFGQVVVAASWEDDLQEAMGKSGHSWQLPDVFWRNLWISVQDPLAKCAWLPSNFFRTCPGPVAAIPFSQDSGEAVSSLKQRTSGGAEKGSLWVITLSGAKISKNADVDDVHLHLMGFHVKKTCSNSPQLWTNGRHCLGGIIACYRCQVALHGLPEVNRSDLGCPGGPGRNLELGTSHGEVGLGGFIWFNMI